MALLLDLLVTGQTRLNDDTYAKNIYADKFIRTGSSDLYVLLGGGGHKLLSDFSMSHSHPYLPLAGGTMTGAINLSSTNAKLAFGSLATSPITGYKAPSLLSNGVGIYSRYGGSSDEGAIIITEDTCVIYNSSDTGWNFQVMDKDIGTDMTNDATRSFGVNQNHQAWSLAGFVKSGSSDSYVLLGGGGHKLLSDFSMAHSHPYLPLAGGTMTGSLTVKQYIFGYNYNHAGGDAPSFVFDKPGSHHTGIGANGEADTIYFSAATISNGEASWVKSYKQKWKFNGTIYQDNNAVIHSGNYNSYAPTLTGTGASGTWNISISGNAATATNAPWSGITGKPTTFTPSAHTHYSIVTEGDNRSVATIPTDYGNSFVFRGLKDNDIIGSPSSVTYSYLIGLRGWSDNSGGQAHELAFNNSGIFRRQGSTTEWGSWYQLIDTGNFTKSLVEGVLTGNITSHTHSYLPLSGGTISGALTIKANGYPLIEFKAGDITRGYYGFSGTGIAAIWDTKNWQTLLHSGNYNTYVPTLTGTGASGTWGISISGNAATATNAPWSGITGKPTTFTPSAHTHTASEITGLPTALSAFTNDVGYITGITKSMVERVLTGNITSHRHSQYLTSALRPAKLFTSESLFPPGYFIITINNNNSKWILSFDVKIVVSDGSYTIRFSEDNSTKSESWYRPSASMIDGEDSVKVKFGYSRTNKWVAILATDSYAGVSITNVANGYAPIDTYALDKLFTIDFFGDWGVLEGDESGLELLGTVQETITIYPPSKEGHTHTFASLTSKPTTINGYGITDALTTSNYNSYVPTRTGTGASGTWGISISGNAATATSAGTAGNADTVDNYHASNLTKFYLSPMSSGAPADSAKSWFINTMPSASGAIVYNVPGSEKTIIAGKSSGAHGHMLQLNYDDNYLRILRYYGGSWKTTDWEKISAGYADSAGSVAWGNITGKPSTFTPSSHSHNYLPLSGGTCTGNIYAPAFYESSDERLKDFYNSIDVDLDKLSLLPKKFFKWKSNPNGEFEIGTSAQELQKIYPQLVNTDGNGYLTVAYDKLSIIALRAIDKLYEMNKNLERRIQILESKH